MKYTHICWPLGWEDPPKQEMTTHSRILAWKISWTEELGRLQSMGSQRVIHDWAHTRISVQLLSRVWLFAAPWTVAPQASLSITNSQSLLTLKSTKSVMPSNHLILCHPLLLLSLQTFPASGSFPMSQFFISGGQSIGVSASAWLSFYNLLCFASSL